MANTIPLRPEIINSLQKVFDNLVQSELYWRKAVASRPGWDDSGRCFFCHRYAIGGIAADDTIGHHDISCPWLRAKNYE